MSWGCTLKSRTCECQDCKVYRWHLTEGGRYPMPPAPTYQPSNLADMREKLREEIANTGDT